ncbi:DUF4190 domain-containing protein [Nonomuraea sp. NPDC050547]|uniref:DUF4190 domain-containing protein n=1 Tax=unclassified Nonomuraea TaxID=2593643 RepID=UPI00379BC3E3
MTHTPGQSPPTTSGTAVGSLVCGIVGLVVSWCLFGIPSIVAIVMGHVAARQTKRGLRGGHGMAVAGLILGYVVVVPAVLVSAFVVLAYLKPGTTSAAVNGLIDGLFGR